MEIFLVLLSGNLGLLLAPSSLPETILLDRKSQTGHLSVPNP